MKLVVGLGNPGPRYEGTRHNVGFLIVDLLAEEAGASWTEQKAFEGLVARGRLLENDCIFLKPMTFMNLSGRSVQRLMQYFKIEPQDLVVVSDDIDQEPQKVKARQGGGHGGHNGLRDMIEVLGTADFGRIKVGVGKPPAALGPAMDTASWVLGKMGPNELEGLRGPVLEEVKLRLKNIWVSK